MSKYIRNAQFQLVDIFNFDQKLAKKKYFSRFAFFCFVLVDIDSILKFTFLWVQQQLKKTILHLFRLFCFVL